MLCDLNNIQGSHEAGDEKWEKKTYWGEKETGWESRVQKARWKKENGIKLNVKYQGWKYITSNKMVTQQCL